MPKPTAFDRRLAAMETRARPPMHSSAIQFYDAAAVARAAADGADYEHLMQGIASALRAEHPRPRAADSIFIVQLPEKAE